jgi:hypothetical protein
MWRDFNDFYPAPSLLRAREVLLIFQVFLKPAFQFPRSRHEAHSINLPWPGIWIIGHLNLRKRDAAFLVTIAFQQLIARLGVFPRFPFLLFVLARLNPPILLV